MLKKLLGGAKKEKFFLELDETNDPSPSESKQEDTPTEGVATPESSTETPQPEAAPKAVKTKRKFIKKAVKNEGVETDIIETSPDANNGQVAQKEEPKEVEFATKFYMISTPRRRPGPSLGNFKDMASEVKVPRVQ